MFISYPRARFLSASDGHLTADTWCYRTSRVGRWSVPGAADECAQFRGGLIGPRGGTIGRTGGCLGPFMRRLTPQVVAQAGRPHCHLSGPAAQERVTTTSKRAHRPTRAQSGARAQNHGVNVQTLPTRRGEQMPPPSIPTFPHQKAKKSHYQQHAVSYNPALTALSRKQTRPWPARTNVRTASHGLIPTDALSVVSYLISPR